MNAVILISGNGSNLQSIIDNANIIGIDIQVVISNVADAFGLARAKNANIPTEISLSKGKTRTEFEQDLMGKIDKFNPNIIILAGFMRILTNDFVVHYQDKILNIHPSLLPKFKGLNTHQRAIDAGEVCHGATVHVVTNELDSGDIIMQKSVKISKKDTKESLAKKVLKEEHILYPQAIRRFIQNV